MMNAIRATSIHEAAGHRRQDQDRQAEHRKRQADQSQAGAKALQEEAPDHVVGAGRKVAADVDHERRHQPAVEQADRCTRFHARSTGRPRSPRPPGARLTVSRAGTPWPPGAGPAWVLGPPSRRESSNRDRRHDRRRPGEDEHERRCPPNNSAPTAPIAGPSSSPPICAAPYSPNASPRRSGGVASVR